MERLKTFFHFRVAIVSQLSWQKFLRHCFEYIDDVIIEVYNISVEIAIEETWRGRTICRCTVKGLADALRCNTRRSEYCAASHFGTAKNNPCTAPRSSDVWPWQPNNAVCTLHSQCYSTLLLVSETLWGYNKTKLIDYLLIVRYTTSLMQFSIFLFP